MFGLKTWYIIDSTIKVYIENNDTYISETDFDDGDDNDKFKQSSGSLAIGK